MDRQRFIWKPLNSAKGEIRLLLLYPNDFVKGKPQGRLETVSLSDHPPYEAISWAWSRSEWSYPMVLDNDELLIPKSLYRCLQRLRQPSLERRLWIDVLCIAQHDEKERAQQVQIMHRIFYDATKVHAWLGEGCNDSGRGIQVLAQSYPEPHDGIPRDPNHSDFHAMGALGTARYWQRLWPVSEQVLAGNLTLHYAGFTLTPDQFPAAGHRLKDVQEYLGKVSPNTLLLRNIDGMRVSITRLIRRQRLLETCRHSSALQKARALLSLFYSGRYQEVSDHKDRIYGLLGVYTALLGETIAVDYAKPVCDVHLDFARHFMESTNSLIILNQATPHKNALSKLPSWVPDWSSQYRHQQEINILPIWAIFTACGNIYIPRPPMQINGGALTLAAVQLDAVVAIGEPYRWSTRNHNTVERWYGIYVQHARTDESAFARTLCPGVSRFAYSDEVFANVEPLEPGEAEDRLETAFHAFNDVYELSDEAAKDLIPVVDVICDSRFFMTQRGRPGLGPTSTQPGDVVMVALGANVPLLLRPTDHDGATQWSFVGELYVDGIMHGEAMEGLSEHDFGQITIQ